MIIFEGFNKFEGEIEDGGGGEYSIIYFTCGVPWNKSFECLKKMCGGRIWEGKAHVAQGDESDCKYIKCHDVEEVYLGKGESLMFKRVLLNLDKLKKEK